MAITQFTTPVPQSTDPDDTFDVRADILVGELPPFVDEMNVEIININTKAAQVNADTITTVAAKDAAVAAANFKGAWADLTGALNIPASVSHSGAVWLLINSLADVTLSEPSGANANWLKLDFVSETLTLTAGTGLTGGGDLTLDRTFSVDVATAANLRAGTSAKVLDAASVYAANAPVVSSGSGSFAPDFAAGRVFDRTLTGNSTLANPTNQVAGQTGTIFIKQDATGSRTLAYGSHWKFSLSVPVLDIAPNAEEAIGYYVKAPGEIRCSFLEPFV